MKLRLNLYTQALQPERESISLKLVVQLLSGLVLVLVLTGWLLDYRGAALKADLEQAQQQTDEAKKHIEQLQVDLSKKQPTPALVSQQAELTLVVAQREKLLGFVQSEQTKAAVKYSPVLEYLASIDPQGFWLTTFTLAPQSSTFQGYVLKAELLPAWLNQLSQNAFFKGQSFAQFELQQEKEHSQALFFVVQSELGTATGEAP